MNKIHINEKIVIDSTVATIKSDQLDDSFSITVDQFLNLKLSFLELKALSRVLNLAMEKLTRK